MLKLVACYGRAGDVEVNFIYYPRTVEDLDLALKGKDGGWPL